MVKVNRVDKLANVFGIELNEEFDLVDCDNGLKIDNCPYKFTERGLVDCNNYADEWCAMLLITGEFEIAKKPWKPKDREIVYYKTISGVGVGSFFESDIKMLAYYHIGNIFKTEEEAEQFDYEFLIKGYEESEGLKQWKTYIAN